MEGGGERIAGLGPGKEEGGREGRGAENASTTLADLDDKPANPPSNYASPPHIGDANASITSDNN